MLRLKMPSEPKWAELAKNNLKEAMIDHAFCEQKAASSAISLIVTYPEYSELVEKLSAVAIEEMEHFRMVHEKILARGWTLGKERRDEYVNGLSRFFKGTKDRKVRLVQRLLFSAMIEARSCERFRVLAKSVDDNELADFYNMLVKSEAEHYTMFIGFAKKYGEGLVDVDALWEKYLVFEAELIQNYNSTPEIHG